MINSNPIVLKLIKCSSLFGLKSHFFDISLCKLFLILSIIPTRVKREVSSERTQGLILFCLACDEQMAWLNLRRFLFVGIVCGYLLANKRGFTLY